MNNQRKHLIGIFFSLLIIFAFINVETVNTSYLSSGISSTFKDFKEFYQGLKNFGARVSSIFNLIGFNTFLLFSFVIFLSSGLSAIGVPRGRFSLIVSLFIANSIWILWEKSFSPESYKYMWGIFKSNLFILIPAIIFLILKYLLPLTFNFVKKQALSSDKNQDLKRMDYINFSEEYLINSTNFQKFFFRDLHNSENSETVSLSTETIEFSKKVKDLLMKLEKK